MRVCVIGSGGREHALADTLSKTAEVVVVPGSPGISSGGTSGSETSDSETSDSRTPNSGISSGAGSPNARAASPTPISISAKCPTDIAADLFVIGPEGPLADGLADRLRAAGKLVFGPGRDGAQLESSKMWMKQLVEAAGVPTARYRAFSASGHGVPDGHATSPECAAMEFLATLSPPYVIKTDGLAAGKGVLVTDSIDQARDDIAAKLSGEAFGEAGQTLVIEEGLAGPEVSIFAICDGTKAVVIPTAAQDHKRLGDGDTGPNTGGMGCFSPVPDVGPAEIAELARLTIEPTMAELMRRGINYRGVLYAGLMLTADGPRLLEFNVRFGDPEAQVILPRIEGNLTELLRQAAAGDLVDVPTVSDEAMVCVVCAADGYPAAPRTGDTIAGLSAAAAVNGATIYTAGVASAAAAPDAAGAVSAAAAPDAAGVVSAAAAPDAAGAVSAAAAPDLVTAGGRVLGVCGRGLTLAQARRRAYAAVDKLSWHGMQYRSDIAAQAALTLPRKPLWHRILRRVRAG